MKTLLSRVEQKALHIAGVMDALEVDPPRSILPPSRPSAKHPRCLCSAAAAVVTGAGEEEEEKEEAVVAAAVGGGVGAGFVVGLAVAGGTVGMGLVVGLAVGRGCVGAAGAGPTMV